MTGVAVGILQNALPPYTMRCLHCGIEWDPVAKTDSGREREARKHMDTCGGPQDRATPPGARGAVVDSPASADRPATT